MFMSVIDGLKELNASKTGYVSKFYVLLYNVVWRSVPF
jgi:hypothetical protein